MKKMLLIFLLFITFIISPRAGDHSFSFKFELNSTAINRALNYQYNQENFSTVINGSVDNITYTLTLSAYSIEFNNNNIQLYMEVDVVSSEGNFENIILKPSISIPQGSISTDQVKAILLDLPNKVQEITWIPQWLKTVLVSTYNSLEPWVYPSKLLNMANNSSTFLKQRNVDLDSTNLELGYQVINNKLILTVTAYGDASKPDFWVIAYRGKLNEQYYNIFSVLSNIQVKIKEVLLIHMNGTIVWHGYPDAYCEKDQYRDIDMGELSNFGNTGCYIARVLYEINETFYVREYPCVIYTGYSGASKFINN